MQFFRNLQGKTICCKIWGTLANVSDDFKPYHPLHANLISKYVTVNIKHIRCVFPLLFENVE